MSLRARSGAFFASLLLFTAVFGICCAGAAAEEDSWDVSGMSIGFGGVYDQSNGLYYDWCGPRNTLRAVHVEHVAGLIPQYSVDHASWVPFVDSVTFTVDGAHASRHTVGHRWVDPEGAPVPQAGEGVLYMALDVTGPATKASYPVKVRRFGVATFRFRVRDRGSRADIVRIVVKRMNGKRVAGYRVGRTEIKVPATYTRRISLPKGRYRWSVMAVDRTGNPQVSVGRNTLVVK
jgi:hypothetical protein